MNSLPIRTWVKYTALFFCLVVTNLSETNGQTICVERKDKIPFTGKKIFICEGKNVGLTAKLCTPVAGKIGFRWTYLNDSYISTTNSSIAIPDTGAYEIVATLPSGVVHKDTFNIQYFKTTFFEIVTNPLPLKCEGVPLTLKATKGILFSDYHWFTAGDSGTISRTDTLYNVQKDTTYIVSALDKNKCLVADTFQVVQSPFVPKVNIGPKDTILCEGNILELKNLLTDTYDHFWSTGELDETINVLQSGKYWLKVRNTFRCTATDTINVTVVPVPKINTAKNFYSCFGSGVQIGIELNVDPSLYKYEWTPKQNIDNNLLARPTVNPASTTRYSVKLSTKAGCGDTASVVVFINPKLTVSVNTKDTSSCPGIAIDLRASATGGTGNISPSPTYDFKWKPAIGIDFPNAANVKAKPAATTTYTVLVKDAKACYDSATVRIKISQLIAKIGASRKGDVCLGDTISLNNTIIGGTGPFMYQWSSNHTLPNDSISPKLVYSASKQGNLSVKLKITDNGNCSSLDSVALIVNGIPVLGSFSSTKKICVGDTSIFPLNASGGSGTGYSFAWLPSDLTIRNNGTNMPVITGRSENIGNKTFYIRATDSKLCSSKPAMLVLQTVPDYQVNFGKADTSLCQGNTIVLEPKDLFNKGLIFSWTRDGAISPISTDSIYTISSAGKYTLGIKNPSTGCASYGSKNVAYIEKPAMPLIAAAEETCANTSILLIGKAGGKELMFSWSGTGSGTFENKNADTAYYIPGKSESGNIKIQLAVKNTCGQADTSRQLFINSLPSIQITTSSQEIFKDSIIVLNATVTNDEKVSWNFGDGTATSSGIETSHIFLLENTYYIVASAKNNKGCLASDSVRILVIEGVRVKEIFIPNVFSPLSSDKDNSSLKIFGKNISSEEFTFRVYNKWGEVIYHTDNLTEAKEKGWNGNFLNADQAVNVGLYTYTVKGKFTDGTPIEKAGSATLLK